MRTGCTVLTPNWTYWCAEEHLTLLDELSA